MLCCVFLCYLTSQYSLWLSLSLLPLCLLQTLSTNQLLSSISAMLRPKSAALLISLLSGCPDLNSCQLDPSCHWFCPRPVIFYLGRFPWSMLLWLHSALMSDVVVFLPQREQWFCGLGDLQAINKFLRYTYFFLTKLAKPRWKKKWSQSFQQWQALLEQIW